jgi:hypothetical protein
MSLRMLSLGQNIRFSNSVWKTYDCYFQAFPSIQRILYSRLPFSHEIFKFIDGFFRRLIFHFHVIVVSIMVSCVVCTIHSLLVGTHLLLLLLLLRWFGWSGMTQHVTKYLLETESKGKRRTWLNYILKQESLYVRKQVKILINWLFGTKFILIKR